VQGALLRSKHLHSELSYKRLEKGCFTWPQSGDAQGRALLSHEELALLLGGIDLSNTKHKRWYRKASPEGHAAV
jgi:hypothetical protein